MKVSCKILNPVFFLKHMKSVAQLCYEGHIQFHNGIKFVGMEPSRLALMELKMADDYVETDSGINLSAPVNIFSLSKIIARFSNPENLTMIYDNLINMVIIKGDVSGRKKTFRLSTIDIKEENIPMEKLQKIQYNAIFKISGSYLLDAIKDCEIYSDIVTFKAVDENLIVSSTGTNGDTKIIIDLNAEIDVSEESSYAIAYLKKILAPMTGSDILMMLKKNHPVAIYDKISDKSHMLYYLAPRVDD